jgi:hypothetical protein
MSNKLDDPTNRVFRFVGPQCRVECNVPTAQWKQIAICTQVTVSLSVSQSPRSTPQSLLGNRKGQHHRTRRTHTHSFIHSSIHLLSPNLPRNVVRSIPYDLQARPTYNHRTQFTVSDLAVRVPLCSFATHTRSTPSHKTERFCWSLAHSILQISPLV